jgi:2-polyprenyl-3-methyl-5-hydroxy-6-metoxy-1,4-benzoquinol methylase
MELAIAVKLIDKGIDKNADPQQWADLGAGQGLFTRALASLLPAASTLYAIDKDATALDSISTGATGVILHRHVADFTAGNLVGEPLDGVLMANALHFVEAALTLLRGIKAMLKPSGRIILVEYNRHTASRWVPYPISFDTLQTIAPQAGFLRVTKLQEVPSVYDDAGIYSALLE